MKTTHNIQTETKTHAREKSALDLLKADHQSVMELFSEYEETRTEAKKQKLATEICDALTVHTQGEEELFYPEAQAALKDKGMILEASVEHSVAKELIAQIEGGGQDSETRDAMIKVLSEYVAHHIKEEQGEIFRAVRQTSIDLQDLGNRMKERFESLRAAKH